MRALTPVVVGLAALVVFTTGFHSLVDPDVWFHLASGRWILAHGFPKLDPFSYPSADQPYVDLHWLFQLVLLGAYRLAGERGLVLLACALLAGAYFLVYKATRRVAPAPLAAALVAFGAIVGSERTNPRPELLSFVFLALTSWLVGRHREGARRAAWCLPPIFALWVNCHGLYVLGYFILAAGLLDSKPALGDRKLWLVSALCVLAALANPWGLEGALHPARLFTRINHSMPIYSETIAELRGPFDGEEGVLALLAFPWYLALLGLGLLACGRWPRPGELLLLAAFVWLALSAQRNLGLLPIAITPILARWLTEGEAARRLAARWRTLRLSAPSLRAFTSAAAVIGMSAYLLGAVTGQVYARGQSNRRFGTGRAPVDFARGAAAFVVENDVRGPIFETFVAGSYFTWAVPQEKVFIDPRTEVHSTEHYARYLQLRQGGPAWGEADARYRFNAAVIHYMDATGLTLERLADPSWMPVYLDDATIVFLRRTEQNRALIDAFGIDLDALRARFRPADLSAPAAPTLPPVPNALVRTFGPVEIPWSRLNLAQLFLSLGLPDLAVPLLVEGVREAPGLAAPRVLLTKALLALGEPSRAEPILASAESIGGAAGVRVRTATLRGDLAMVAGRTDDAIRAYDLALRQLAKGREPKTAAALLASRAMAKLQGSNPLAAFGDVMESLRLEPGNAQTWLTLGWIEEARGRREEARRAFQRVEAMAGPTPETQEALARLGN